MKFVPLECPVHAREVHVEYIGYDDFSGVHSFRVSSLSRPLSHTVNVRISERWTSKETPESLLNKSLVQVYSSDEFFTFGGCNYNCTVRSASLFPEFRAPHSPSHDYLCSHTLLAVLDVLTGMGPGILQESFSKSLMFNNNTLHYDLS